MLSAAECATLRAEARRVLDRNRRRGVSIWAGRAFDFVCPSVAQYPFQWLWDSCFHAIALARIDVARACRELQGLLDAAAPSGFIPHIIFWEKERFLAALARYNVVFGGSHTTATIQPPMLAIALERVATAGAPADWVRRAIPPAVAYCRWLARERDPDGDGLIAILQPDESGLDAAPQFDAALGMARPDEAALRQAMGRLFAAYAPHRGDDRRCLALDVFHVESVLVNVIWIESLRALTRLITRYGLPPAPAAADEAGGHPAAAVPATPPASAAPTADELTALAERARTTLLERCYDAATGAFYDLVGVAEEPSRVLTVSSLMPLYLPDLPPALAARLVREHLTCPDRFWLPYPVPSVAASEPSFEPDFGSGLVWRGPTWINTNWFLVHGLRHHGYAALADELAERTASLALRSGLRECYDPYTGAGYGACDFGWSALVIDLLPETDDLP
ncbi:MAG: hypothetical protein HY691_02305 [Chloroflexi bacterium]|nr:hypothetical protein [Chloroflexota bacterium]